ncbi:MAG: hypothetical protein D3917_13345 [Candidatus Electrothrix sp. AX5]|nr:hypothetical protein [Candidatus Electrothrix sp. AX5]
MREEVSFCFFRHFFPILRARRRMRQGVAGRGSGSGGTLPISLMRRHAKKAKEAEGKFSSFDFSLREPQADILENTFLWRISTLIQ